jgi:hypothetical protein
LKSFAKNSLRKTYVKLPQHLENDGQILPYNPAHAPCVVKSVGDGDADMSLSNESSDQRAKSDREIGVT